MDIGPQGATRSVNLLRCRLRPAPHTSQEKRKLQRHWRERGPAFCRAPFTNTMKWHEIEYPLDRHHPGRPGGRRAGDHRRRVDRNGRPSMVPAAGDWASGNPSPGGRALADQSSRGRRRFARGGGAFAGDDPLHPLRLRRGLAGAAGQGGRPGRAGGLRGRGGGGQAGSRPPRRRHRHRPPAQGGDAPRRLPLSRAHRVAGRTVRRERLRHDALLGSGRHVGRRPAGWPSST